MPILVYNTLTKRKEELIPAKPNWIRMYVCGPTTYNLIHLGNARPLVVFDTIRRYLVYRGYRVTFVQNFTDVDDKIINRAREEGQTWREVAERYIREFWRDAASLGVQVPDTTPRASEHIPEMIELISLLVEKGYAYVSSGDVYFEVSSFPSYGQLSGHAAQELRAGARVEPGEAKRDPLDFALWKSAKPGEPAWDSPWGPGRPGWHIECSAMSLKYLGTDIDIHGGGADLIFPHHENEIAQSEAATGERFVRYWLHNGFITVNKEKMSKSTGNFFLVREILREFPGAAVRLFLLSTHYRSPLDFDRDGLDSSARGLSRLNDSLALLDKVLESKPVKKEAGDEDALTRAIAHCRQEFERAMDDDFNTALALGEIFEFVRAVNGFINRADFVLTEKAYQLLSEARCLLEQLAGEVLGIDISRAARDYEPGEVKALVELLLEVRNKARRKKDWEIADFIRERLKGLGIRVEDTPWGVRWFFDVRRVD